MGGLEIYFRSDLAQNIQSAAQFAARVYVGSGGRNPDYLKGILDMAENQATQYGLYWPDMLHNIRAGLGEDALRVLEPTLLQLETGC